MEIKGETLIYAIDKEVDHHNAEKIRKTVEEFYISNRLRNIIFDFSKVRFMDSSGIGMCIGRYKLVKSRNGKFAICNPTYESRRIFDMAGLDKIISVYDNLDVAINDFEGELK